ncbi:MAG: 30S ribosomal protein S9 [Candidatus Yonathbacteria bacterium]|nr:30S ribosomal protein S9 [Candidatus Yonathbacteria bacterium]
MSATTTAKKYIEAVGRRKTAIARVRITEGGSGFVVNDRPIAEYFPTESLQNTAMESFVVTGQTGKFGVSAKIVGGGVSAQAEAVRHGLSRALVKYDEELRKALKPVGFMKRDPRSVERKKFGLKKARRASQWSKR